FAAKEDRLNHTRGKAPIQLFKHAYGIELCSAQSAGGAERETGQTRGAGLIGAMKRCSEPAFGSQDIGPALEQLRGQSRWRGFRLSGEGAARGEFSRRVAAGHNLDCADGLGSR